MADSDRMTFFHRVRRLAAEVGGAGDAQLLERFATSRDEAAFESLVWRHARLVFGVCRRVLHDVHDAEDAFQATFLALARRAGRIERREAVAGWLYQVAFRTALTARTNRTRKARRERLIGSADELLAPLVAQTTAERDEMRSVLDEELSKLPALFRAPLVLCYLEGKTVDEAARQLGCPRGTVASRLARARQRLRTRLEVRGLALAAGLAMIDRAAAAPRPLSLIPALIPAAVRLAAGGPVASVSPQVASLTEEVLKAMFFHKLKTGAAVLVTGVGILLAGGGLGVRLFANVQIGDPPTGADDPTRIATTSDNEKPRQDSAAEKAKPVTVVHPVVREVPSDYIVGGRLEAGRTWEVRASANGRLDRSYVQGGASVKKGELLFEIDPKAYELTFEKASAELEIAEARKKQSDAELSLAQRLVAGKNMSREELSKMTTNAAVADATSKAASVDVMRARLNLEGTKIRAPADGQLSRLLVEPGTFLSADHPTLLATITSLDPIGLIFPIDERSYLRYRRLPPDRAKAAGMIDVGLANEQGLDQKGTFTGFDDRLDPKTGTVQGHGVLANRDRLLLPGMFARVRMTFGPPSRRLTVPHEAMQSPTGNWRGYVCVIDARERVEFREVTLEPIRGGLYAVDKGLRPDDWVVVDRVPLQPGDLVLPKRTAPAKD